jgi:putative hydrolase of the HAD superfamily
MTVRGVIFDVGRTLVWDHGGKFEGACTWAAVSLLRSRGFSGDPEELWQRILEFSSQSCYSEPDHQQRCTTREILRGALTSYGIHPGDELLNAAEEAFVAPEAVGSPVIPDMVETVRALSGHVRLAAMSNTRSHRLIERILEHLGLEGVFDPIMTSAVSGWRKPHPAMFEAALRRWRLPPREVVMVGDKPETDLAGARAVGMRTLWFKMDCAKTSSFRADAVADTVEEL